MRDPLPKQFFNDPFNNPIGRLLQGIKQTAGEALHIRKSSGSKVLAGSMIGGCDGENDVMIGFNRIFPCYINR
jgi:hypothetical protein